MNNYYEHSNLPKPVLPAAPPIEILKGQTALVTVPTPELAVRLRLRSAGPALMS